MTEQRITLTVLTRAYEEWLKENPDAFCCLIRVREDMAGALIAEPNGGLVLEAQNLPVGAPRQVIYKVSGGKQVVIELVEDRSLGERGYKIYMWHAPRTSQQVATSTGA
jgi:hypothetical protein